MTKVDTETSLRIALSAIVSELERITHKLMRNPNDPEGIIMKKLKDVHAILTSI